MPIEFGDWRPLPGHERTIKERWAKAPSKVWVWDRKTDAPKEIEGHLVERRQFAEEFETGWCLCNQRWTIFSVDNGTPGHPMWADYYLRGDLHDVFAMTREDLLGKVEIMAKKAEDDAKEAHLHAVTFLNRVRFFIGQEGIIEDA